MGKRHALFESAGGRWNPAPAPCVVPGMSGMHAHTVEDRHKQATDTEKAETDDVKRARERPTRLRAMLLGGGLVLVAIAGGWFIATL